METYHNSIVHLMKKYNQISEEIIRKVCFDLDKVEQTEEMIMKYVNFTKNKLKKIKDPDRQKKPKSAYLLFCDDERPGIYKENPEFKMGDVAKILGSKWRALDDESKQKYFELYENNKPNLI